MMLLLDKKAPDFTADAVLDGERIVNDFTLSSFHGKQDVLLFFYPKDFTQVCPTEIVGFQNYLEDFKRRGVAVVGVSTDTAESHLAWLSMPRDKGGIEGITYPLVADVSKTISLNYGILGGDYDYNDADEWQFEGIPVAYRGAFLIDKKGIVRHQSINDMMIARNPLDYLHIVDRLRYLEKNGTFVPCSVAEPAPEPMVG